MLNWLIGIAGLLLGFSWLIFIHELGHFLLAKWNGVRVYVFSLGMGPYLVSFTWRGTVYVLSMIPVGGYVKMMGQDDLSPDSETSKDPHDYRNKRPGQKAAILAAGAIFNLIFTVIAFTICYAAGYEVDAPRLGNISPDVPLAKARLADGQPAQLQKGDRILEVNQVPVKSALDAVLEIAGSRKDVDMVLKIESPAGSGVVKHVLVKPDTDAKTSTATIGFGPGNPPYSEKIPLPLGFSTSDSVVVALEPKPVSEGPQLPSAAAGLKKGDVLLSVARAGAPPGEEIKIKEPYDLNNVVRDSGGKPLTLEVQRDGTNLKLEITPIKGSDLKDKDYKDVNWYILGLQNPYKREVVKIDPASEAYANGLREGDFVYGFSIKDYEWTAAKKLVFKTGELAWSSQKWDPEDKSSLTQTLLSVPAAGELNYLHNERAVDFFKAESFTYALGTAWDDTVHYVGSVYGIVRGLLTGDVSLSALSGPAGIGGIIMQTAREKPLLHYLWMLGFISLNLGALQFVPIPLLDGFHLVMVLVEKLKGSPVALRVQIAFQYVGMLIVGMLIIYATFNDIKRMVGL